MSGGASVPDASAVPGAAVLELVVVVAELLALADVELEVEVEVELLAVVVRLPSVLHPSLQAT